MKTHVKRCGLLSALFLGSALAASAVPVTYQVNLSVQAALGNFNPGNGDTVLVSGNWDGWSITNTLSVSPDPDIYTITLDQAAGSWPNYKFVINPYGTSSGPALKWEESIPDRWFQVPGAATNLPVVYFDNVTNVSSVIVVPVTFQVDMSVQAELGNFNPATDYVYVSGAWDWEENTAVQLTQSVTDTNVWAGTLNITNTPGTTVNYKFHMNTFSLGRIWESDGVGPGGAQNRQFIFPETATNLPAVYFNNVTNTTSMVTVPVTFAVNLAVEIARGVFNPDYDTVHVSGDAVNNWNSPGSQLTRSGTNLNLWTGTFDITNVVGSTVNYKFVQNNSLGIAWENNGVGPGGAQNRQFSFPETATNLPSVFWNNIGNLGTLTNSVAGDQITLSWGSGPLIRLQSATDLGGGVWVDVPDTLGQSSFTTNTSSGMECFRLIGP
jgi:hypothetical protein